MESEGENENYEQMIRKTECRGIVQNVAICFSVSDVMQI